VTITAENLDQELDKIPLLPATTNDTLNALQSDDINFTLVEHYLSCDPSLAARVLRIANSPFYGLSGKIDNLRDACVVLGVHTTRTIVLAAAVSEHLKSTESTHLDLIALWRHAIGTGVAAKTLAIEIRINPEMAFTAGLLHDIGKVILDIYFPTEYTDVITYRDREHCQLNDAENAVLGIDHTLVGAKVARRWSLPATIAEAIENHHCINVETTSKAANLIQVAVIVSRHLKFGNPGDSITPPFDMAVLQRLGLDIPTIEQHYSEIENQYHQVADSFI
jgi:putative nucleotidyltransferase with HDIG domain